MFKKLSLIIFTLLLFYSSALNSFASCVPPISNPYGKSCSYSGKFYYCTDPSLPTNYSIVSCCDLPSDCPSGTSGTILNFIQQYLCPDKVSINTALGCIPYEYIPFTAQTLKWGTLSAGFFTFLIIVYASILMIMNGHDPKKIQAGQELITSSLAGLAMIAICVLLVNYLGATLLNLGPIGFRQ